MLVSEMNYTDISSGAQEINDFSVEVDATLMRQMFSQIAKDKIAYPIREICSNAWDAAKGDFVVELPTHWAPIFRVRDFGSGLSHDDVMRVYTRVGKSLKRDTNEKVGSKGWGSKSPLAYLTSSGDGSAAFNVKSFHDGEVRHYIMALAASGMPQARFMFAEPMGAEDRTGLEVSFPVRTNDIYKFEDAARKILWFFPPRPSLTPLTFKIQSEIETITKTGDGWSLHDLNAPFRQPMVRMGCVGYPIDFDLIGLGDWPWKGQGIVFEADIGSIELQTSREELSYDDKTKQTLVDLIANFEIEFVEQVRDAIDDQPNYMAACGKLTELATTFGWKQVEYVAKKIKYRNRVTLTRNHTINLDLTRFMHHEMREADELISYRSYRPDRSANRQTYMIGASMLSESKIIVEMKVHRSAEKIQSLNLPVGTKIFWMRPFSEAARDLMLDRFDLSIGEVIDLDKIKLPPIKRGSVSTPVDRTLVKCRALKDDSVIDTRLDLSGGGVYILDQDGARKRYRHFRVNRDGNCYGGRGISYNRIAFAELGILDKDAPILVLKPNDPIPEGWIYLGEHVETKIDAMINWRQVKRHVATGAEVCSNLRKICGGDTKLNLDLTRMPTALASLITRTKKFPEARAKIKIPEKTVQLWDLRKSYAVNKAPVTDDGDVETVTALNQEMDALFKCLPVFENLLSNTGYYYANNNEPRERLLHYLNLELIAEKAAS